jgi:hypothetical protein
MVVPAYQQTPASHTLYARNTPLQEYSTVQTDVLKFNRSFAQDLTPVCLDQSLGYRMHAINEPTKCVLIRALTSSFFIETPRRRIPVCTGKIPLDT